MGPTTVRNISFLVVMGQNINGGFPNKQAFGDGGTDLTGLGTDNTIARWDGTDTLQNSGITISDTNEMVFSSTTATTANILDIPSADSLTTGSIANFVSNSTDASARNLVLIHNDNGSAGATTALLVTQDANAIAVRIDNNGGSIALRVDTSTGTGLSFIDTIQDIGFVITAASVNNLTTGKIANLQCGATELTSGILLDVGRIASGSLEDATGNIAKFASSITDTDTSGTATENFDNVLISRTDIMNGAGGTMDSDGSLLKLESTATQTAGTLTQDVIGIEMALNSLSASDVYAIKIDNANAGAGFAGGIQIASSTGSILDVVSTATTANLINIPNADSLTTGGILNLVSNSADGGSRLLGLIHNDNAAASGTEVFTVRQDANPVAMTIDHNGSGIALRIDVSATGSAGLSFQVSGQTTGNILEMPAVNSLTSGSAINVRSTNTLFTSGTVLDIDHTSSGALADMTGNIAKFTSSLTDTDTSGTATENFDQVLISRTSIMNGAGGTFLAQGSVLKLENIATQTAGTLTDTVTVLEVNQDADSTGRIFEFQFDSASVFQMTFEGGITTNSAATTSPSFNHQANSNTTGTAMFITANALTTGSGLTISSNSAEADTRNLVFIRNDNTAATGTTPLFIQQDAVTSTNFKKCIEIAGFTIYISDGTTAEGALTGVEGDICLNGGTGAGQTAFCDANGTNWTDM